MPVHTYMYASLCVYVCVHINVYTHVYLLRVMHCMFYMYVLVCLGTCVSCTCVCVHMYRCVCFSVCVYLYVCICVYLYVCKCVCIYVYVEWGIDVSWFKSLDQMMVTFMIKRISLPLSHPSPNYQALPPFPNKDTFKLQPQEENNLPSAWKGLRQA